MAERIYNEFVDPQFNAAGYTYEKKTYVNYENVMPGGEAGIDNWLSSQYHSRILDTAPWSPSGKCIKFEPTSISGLTADFVMGRRFYLNNIKSLDTFTSVFRFEVDDDSIFEDPSALFGAASISNNLPANLFGGRTPTLRKIKYNGYDLWELSITFETTTNVINASGTKYIDLYLFQTHSNRDKFDRAFKASMAQTYLGTYEPAYPWISEHHPEIGNRLENVFFSPNANVVNTEMSGFPSRGLEPGGTVWYRDNVDDLPALFFKKSSKNWPPSEVKIAVPEPSETDMYRVRFYATNVEDVHWSSSTNTRKAVEEGENKFTIAGTSANSGFTIDLSSTEDNVLGLDNNFAISKIFFTSTLSYGGPFFDGDTPPFYYNGELVIPMWEGEPYKSRSFIELGSGIDGEKTIRWNESEDSEYETGVDRGVIFLSNSAAPWNGLVSVTDSFDDSEETPLYEDGEIRYISSIRRNSGLTVESYGIPKELETAMGKKEVVPGLRVWGGPPTTFGLAYQTLKRRPDGTIIGRKLHIVYNCKGRPDELVAQTHDDSNDLDPVSLTLFATVPRDTVFMSSPKIDISADMVDDPIYYDLLELILFGSSYQTPRLLLPSEIADVLEGNFQEYITTGTTDSEDDDI